MKYQNVAESFYDVDRDYSSSKSIVDHLNSLFNKFKNCINDHKNILEHIDKITHEIEIIKHCIKEYENGHIFQAFESFEKLMQLLEVDIKRFIYSDKDSDSFINEHFYRMRLSKERVLDKKNIFHVPFSKRQFIGNQRFSINGLPCLYLSSSIYACWNEMKNPNINDTHVSRFELDKSKRYEILNISQIDPRRLFFNDINRQTGVGKVLINEFDYHKAVSAIVLLPLVISCGLKGSNDNALYKSEYIIPQLLLHWVKQNNKIDGLAFLAVDSDSRVIDPYYNINYVFPTKDNKYDVCSHLNKIFKLTDPIRSDIIEHSQIKHAFGSESLSNRLFTNTRFSAQKNLYYEMTTFGKIEFFLKQCETKNIHI